MICSNCGKKCYRYKTLSLKGEITCWHDEEFSPTRYEGMTHKRQREEHAKDLLQPYNVDGSLSKDFKKVYPNSEFVKRHIGK